MKKVGLVGGISWVSTMEYYKFINEGINSKFGGLNFAECIIYSLNFGDVQSAGWENSFKLLLNACESLKKRGLTPSHFVQTLRIYSQTYFRQKYSYRSSTLLMQLQKPLEKADLKKLDFWERSLLWKWISVGINFRNTGWRY